MEHPPQSPETPHLDLFFFEGAVFFSSLFFIDAFLHHYSVRPMPASGYNPVCGQTVFFQSSVPSAIFSCCFYFLSLFSFLLSFFLNVTSDCRFLFFCLLHYSTPCKRHDTIHILPTVTQKDLRSTLVFREKKRKMPRVSGRSE